MKQTYQLNESDLYNIIAEAISELQTHPYANPARAAYNRGVAAARRSQKGDYEGCANITKYAFDNMKSGDIKHQYDMYRGGEDMQRKLGPYSNQLVKLGRPHATLNESRLNRLISESVKRVLNEQSYQDVYNQLHSNKPNVDPYGLLTKISNTPEYKEWEQEYQARMAQQQPQMPENNQPNPQGFQQEYQQLVNQFNAEMDKLTQKGYSGEAWREEFQYNRQYYARKIYQAWVYNGRPNVDADAKSWINMGNA